MPLTVLLASSVSLLWGVIVHPVTVFKEIRQGKYLTETLILFVLGVLITFLKSFLARGRAMSFFADEHLNQFFSILSLPQIQWLLIHVMYFVFLLGILGLCRLFNRVGSTRSLVFAFMAISAVGVVGQVLFSAIQFVVPQDWLVWGEKFLYLYVISLSLQAIRVTQDLSFPQAFVSFFSPAVVLVALMGLTTIAPYLAWLTLQIN